MSTTSDICFPSELLHEFILQCSSSPSTLAAWCSVSRSLLSFAGPLLYETVSLKRSEDLVPFLERLRLARSSSPPSSSASLLLPFVKGIQRLEILAHPSLNDMETFLEQHPNLALSSNELTLGISWEGQDEVEMATFWIPSILQLVQPQRYEQLGQDSSMYLSGCLLHVYLDSARLLDKEVHLGKLHKKVSQWSLDEAEALRVLESLYLPDASDGTSPLLDVLSLRFEEERASFRSQSILEIAEARMTLPEATEYMRSRVTKFKECARTHSDIMVETSRILNVSVEQHKAEIAVARAEAAALKEERRALQQKMDELTSSFDASQL